MHTKMTRQEIERVAAETADAYSYARYANWKACAAALARRGYTATETEAILRSKHMRWAGDASSHEYGRVTSRDLERYLDDPRNRTGAAEIADLVAQTSLSTGEAPLRRARR